ncbi:MAG TPA: DUF2786 domain-containing protein [Acidimicrobiales bacterium]|jgi:hypothetical protein
MGKTNRRWSGRRRNDDRSIEELLHTALWAPPRELGYDPKLLVDEMLRRAESSASDHADLSRALVQQLTRSVSECWQRGWQPADLTHCLGKRQRSHRQICAETIVLEAAGYRHASGADPAWLAQVEAVRSFGQLPDRAASGETDQASMLGHWADHLGGPVEVVRTVITLVLLLRVLPAQPRLCVPPSEWGKVAPSRSTGRAADPKITERVRALLAKAESTTFPDEAEAFTAKAQELISRHAIDLAMLEGSQTSSEVTGRRILLDDPYSKAKSVLLGVIAQANRCSAVFNQGVGFSTIFGSPTDGDAVELLFTSLLTQATAAMTAAGRTGGARTRGRSFRQSFLLAYAGRIGERLAEATAGAVDDAVVEHGDNVLPVLASREQAAQDARAEAFPHIRPNNIAARSYEGWIAGRAAAETAHLGPKTQLRAG